LPNFLGKKPYLFLRKAILNFPSKPIDLREIETDLMGVNVMAAFFEKIKISHP